MRMCLIIGIIVLLLVIILPIGMLDSPSLKPKEATLAAPLTPSAALTHK